MIGGRATLAIVRTSLRRLPTPFQILAAYAASTSVLAWSAQAAVALGAAAVLATALAALDRGTIADVTNLRYFAAPLYGRELARAVAIAPCAYLVGPAWLLALAQRLVLGAHSAQPHAWMHLAIVSLAVIVTTLVALSGCVRRGPQRRLYFGFAVGAGLAIEILGSTQTWLAFAAPSLAAVPIGFAALRALGETLARYDPLDEAASSY